jgi:Ni2+-binding GTPase involved in maturation of urease and hydrogenase
VCMVSFVSLHLAALAFASIRPASFNLCGAAEAHRLHVISTLPGRSEPVAETQRTLPFTAFSKNKSGKTKLLSRTSRSSLACHQIAAISADCENSASWELLNVHPSTWPRCTKGQTHNCTLAPYSTPVLCAYAHLAQDRVAIQNPADGKLDVPFAEPSFRKLNGHLYV